MNNFEPSLMQADERAMYNEYNNNQPLINDRNYNNSGLNSFGKPSVNSSTYEARGRLTPSIISPKFQIDDTENDI